MAASAAAALKIGILFNCQHHGLRLSLSALRPQDEFISFGFPGLSNSAAMRAAAVSAFETCDAVIAQPTSSVLPPAEMRRLKAAPPRVLDLPAILFAGYHPDAIYIAAGKAQLTGPTEALHSRIGVCGFLGGLSAADTAMLYNRLVFGRLGYDTQFETQTALICERYASFGVAFGPALQTLLAAGCFMHSPNHPKAAALLALAGIACSLLEVEPGEAPESLPDTLEALPSHPVYPDLAGRLGVAPEHMFRCHRAGPNPGWLDLPQFLQASFAVYRSANPADLLRATGVADTMAALGLSPSL